MNQVWWYQDIIYPFLDWVHEHQIQTFVDVIGDIGWVILLPLILACTIKYLIKGGII